jgi:adenosylmethionine-8-amino-7-oxononanoate aminotransferase
MTTAANDFRPDALRDLTRHVMVDFNQMKAFSADPLILVEGDGIRVTDYQGRSYIDGISGVFSVSLGHGNRAIIEAVTQQMQRLSFASPIMATNDRALELASELMRLSGDRATVVKQFAGGSEATEAALKMARQYHRQTGNAQRYKTVSLYRGFHGATTGSLAATGWARQRVPYEPLPAGFIHAHPPIRAFCRACGDGPACTLACARQIRDVIELEGPETISSVILEPVMLTAGVRVPPDGYLRELRRICDETGVLLIYDEIVTGFGRLGSWLAAERFGVWPDLLCVGKGISGGYAPLSAVMLTERVAAAFWGESADNRQFQAGHTYAGNPVSAAAGLAVIRYIEQNGILAQVEAAGARLRERLEGLLGRFPIVGEIRGLGLLYAVEFLADRVAGTPFGADMPVGTAVQQAARRRGLLLRASPHVATLAPPLVTTSKEIDEIADLLEAAIEEVSETLAAGRPLDVEVAFGL